MRVAISALEKTNCLAAERLTGWDSIFKQQHLPKTETARFERFLNKAINWSYLVRSVQGGYHIWNRTKYTQGRKRVKRFMANKEASRTIVREAPKMPI